MTGLLDLFFLLFSFSFFSFFLFLALDTVVLSMCIIPQDNQLSFTVNISRFRRGPIVLALFNSDFRKAVMPENVESMWGPIPFKALPPGTENKCDVASHRLVKVEHHD